MVAQAPSGSPCVFVVDDEPDLRSALALLLKSAGLQTRTFASAAEFLSTVEPNARGCLVLDVRMPGMSGLELQRALNERGWRLPIVFLSGHGDIPMAVQAVQAGAVDFVEKPFRSEILVASIRRALAADQERRQRGAEVEAASRLFGRLSPREREVAALVVEGLTSGEVAERLALSRRTVEMHRARLMRKLGVAGVADLTRLVLTERGESRRP